MKETDIKKFENPFTNKNSDYAEIWEILIEKDIKAFAECNWTFIQGDFIEEKFIGLNAKFTSDFSKWDLTFPKLKFYRDYWLNQAHESAKNEYAEPIISSLHKISYINNIKITSDKATIWKKFNGSLRKKDGSEDILNWQTIYLCEKIYDRWKIIGFVGYLPLT